MSRIEQIADGVTLYLGDCREILPTLGRVDAVGVVLDPYMGAGSTGVVARRRGMGFVGIERESLYFETACRRISAALKQPDMFIERPKPAKQDSFL